MQGTEDTTYEGYTNYETYVVALFLDGNYTGERTYLEVRELARFRVGHPYALASDLREWFEDEIPQLDGIAADLLNAAVSEVNWHELAEGLLEEF